MKRFGKWTAIVIGAMVVSTFVLNTNLFGPKGEGKPTLLAHRGLAQTYHRDGLTNDTCTATRIHAPEHGYLENTLASMQAAFDAGADVVEFDVHPTTDGHFAVFHDWSLDCRTDGSGVTREHSLGDLKKLDIGYGYTADEGRTFPFRGKGTGLMPSLDEVLATFPDRRLLINVKSNDPVEGEKLATALSALAPARLAQLAVYGGAAPVEALQARLPALKAMSRKSLTSCAMRYLGFGWTGFVPQPCRNTLVLVPINYAPLAWGWPDRFLARMHAAGTDVYVTGPHGGGEAGASGIDDAKLFRRLPAGFSGGVWTNRIDRIGRIASR